MSDPQSTENPELVENDIRKIIRSLMGSDDAQREEALRTLPSVPPAAGIQLSERLVSNLVRGSDDSRQKAQVALIALGQFAIPDVIMTAIENKKPAVQLAAIDILLAIGSRMPPSERLLIVTALIDLLMAHRAQPVRDAALRAMLALRPKESGEQ